MVIFFILLLALGVALLKNGLYPLSPIILIGVVVFLLLSFSIFAGWLFKLRFTQWQSRFLLATFLFLTLAWGSLFFSQTKTVGYEEMLLLTDVVGLLFVVPLWWPQIKEKWQDLVFAVITFFGAGNAVFALSQYLVRSETRVAGFFYQSGSIANYYPNAFALSCLLTLPIALYFLLSKKGGKFWCFGLIATVVIGAALILSWSRGGWLGGIGIVGLVLLWAIWQKSKRALFSLALFLILIGGVVCGWQMLRINNNLETNTFIAKAQFAGTEAQTSVGERKDFMTRGLILSWEKPWFGFGPGSFPYVYPSVQTDWLANAPHPHNILIKIALENGYLALMAFLLMIILLIINVVRGIKECPQWVYFVLIALASAFGHNLLDYNFNFVFNFLLFAGFCGLLLSIKKKNDADASRSIGLFILPLLIIILLILPGLPSLLSQKISLRWQDHDRQKVVLNTLAPGLAVGDLYLRLAFLSEEKKNYPESVAYLEKHLLLNNLDAAVWNRLGDNYWFLNKPDEALQAFREALKLDTKNNWSYYFNELNALRVLNDRDAIIARYDEIMLELKAYLPLAEKNVHYTAQSPNLLNAIKTADLLLMYKFSPELEEIMLALNLARKPN